MNTLQVKMYPPSWVVDRVTTKGGMNRFNEPNFRVVWGGNRTHVVGGKFKKIVEIPTGIIGQTRSIVTDVSEMRTLLKYHPQRWHLEKWCGPEWYGSQEEWWTNSWDEEAQLHTMGPYPEKGDYEHVFFLGMCPHMRPGDEKWCNFCTIGSGVYIPLEENIHMIEFQIHSLQLSQDVRAMDEKNALFMREDKKRQVRNNVVSERVMEAMRPKLAVQPTAWQDGTRCSVPEPKLVAGQVLPRGKGLRQSNNVLPNQKQRQLEEK